MRQVTLKQNQIVVGNKKIPLLSGEVHYWRLNPGYWKAVLGQVRDLGINIISTYVPWDYHEYKRGKFDFTGKTDGTRNLKLFLELTRKEGFWVIIRPGPYIYSEWPNDGVPSYAYRYHRLHPKFLEYALAYLKKVCEVIKPYLATRSSGHIILLQADNEIDAWPDIFGQQYGFSGKAGLFQEFIRNRYHHSIEALNRAWETSYKSFEETGPFIACMLKGSHGLPLRGDHELKRNLDYFLFKYDYVVTYGKWCVKAYRQLGINIPIYMNLYPFFYAQDWSEMQKICDFVGIDLYPSSELKEDEFEQRKLIDKARFLTSVSQVSYIAEFAAGVWHARHYESGVMTPNHYRLITLSSLLGGVCGWNWYMLVNRDNWYMSPINEWGRKRDELYDVFRDLVRAFRVLKPYELTKLTHVAVTFNPLQYAARTIPKENKILTALYGADVDYDLFDPQVGLPKRKVIFYSGNQWLSRKAQEHLRRYVVEGGILVAFQDFPRKDEHFAVFNGIGFEEPSRVLFEFKRKFQLSLSRGAELEMVSSVYCFNDVSGKPIQATFGGYGKQTIGYVKKIGKGKLVHLGVEPTERLIHELLKSFHMQSYCHSLTKGVNTAMFSRGKKRFIIAVNNGTEDKSATIQFSFPDQSNGKSKVIDVLSGAVHECVHRERGWSFGAEFLRKDGRIFEIVRAPSSI